MRLNNRFSIGRLCLWVVVLTLGGVSFSSIVFWVLSYWGSSVYGGGRWAVVVIQDGMVEAGFGVPSGPDPWIWLTMPGGVFKPVVKYRDDVLYITIPIWMLTFVCLLSTGLLALPLSTRRRRSRQCRCCGYNLTGNVSGRCPECGNRVPHA